MFELRQLIAIFLFLLLSLTAQSETTQFNTCQLTPTTIKDMRLIRTIYSDLSPNSWVDTIDIDASGTLLLLKKTRGALKIYDLTTFRPIAAYYPENEAQVIITEAAFNDGNSIIIAEAISNYAGKLRLWNLKTHVFDSLTSNDSIITHITRHPAQPMLAFSSSVPIPYYQPGDRQIVIWNLEHLQEVTTLNDIPQKQAQSVSSLIYHPNGTLLLASVLDTVMIWDANTYQLLNTYMPGQFTMTKGALKPDGTMFATASRERNSSGQVKLWGLSDFSKIKTIQYNQEVADIAFSSDSMFFAVATGNQIFIYDAQTFTPLATLPTHHYFTDITFLPQNNFLVIASTTAGVQLWGIHCDE